MSIAVPFTTIVEMFVKLTDKYAGSQRPFLLRKKEGTYQPIRYTEFRDQVAQFAHGLMQLGIRQGDRVAILSENRPEWIMTDLAVLSIGAIDVPIYPSQTAKQIEYIIKDSSSVAIVVSNSFQLAKAVKVKKELGALKYIIIMNEPTADTPPDVLAFQSIMQRGEDGHRKNPALLADTVRTVKASDLCTIIYTSGTTGDPKGVMLTHDNFASNMKSSSQVITISETDLLLSFLPLCHVFERMAGYYTAMSCGATIAYAESIDTVADNLLEVKPTIVCSVPRLFERMYNRIARRVEKDKPIKQKIFYWAVKTGREYHVARKENRVSTTLKLRHRLADKLVFSKLRERTGGRIQYFVSGGAALPRELGEFFEAVGILIIEGYGLTESSPVIAANRLDAYKFGSVGMPIPGVEVKIAEDGEILSRGPNIMKGYYNNKKATEEAIDKDGWLHTGDIGLFDGQGFLYITDRKKHLFVSSGGKNIAPQPIENLFAGNDLIDQFILLGDKRMFLSALIVPDFDVLKEYADSHNIPYKDVKELAKNHEINQLIEKRIQATQKDLANYEKVRRFALLDEPLTIENGGLTPTMKIKRRVVEERYKDLIESLYQT